MDIAFLIGRIIFGLIFILFGLNHFKQRKGLTGYAESKGVKGAGALVPLSGLMIVLGGLSVATGLYPRIGLVLITVFLVGVSFIMHDFWSQEGQARQSDMQHFMKNMALAGASLALLVFELPWPLSL